MNSITYEVGANVYNHKNEKVGTIDRLVIDPQTNEVTHIVVHKGFLFTKDKVIPTPMIERVEDGHFILSNVIENIDQLQDFEAVSYVSIDSDEAAEVANPADPNRMYWYPTVAQGATLTYPPFYDSPYPVQMTIKEKNIPKGSIPLKRNASVYSRNGDHLGKVDQIFTNPDTQKATFFVIKEGFFFTEDKLVPAWWVDVTKEDEVHLAVDSSVFAQLPAFEPTN